MNMKLPSFDNYIENFKNYNTINTLITNIFEKTSNNYKESLFFDNDLYDKNINNDINYLLNLENIYSKEFDKSIKLLTKEFINNVKEVNIKKINLNEWNNKEWFEKAYELKSPDLLQNFAAVLYNISETNNFTEIKNIVNPESEMSMIGYFYVIAKDFPEEKITERFKNEIIRITEVNKDKVLPSVLYQYAMTGSNFFTDNFFKNDSYIKSIKDKEYDFENNILSGIQNDLKNNKEYSKIFFPLKQLLKYDILESSFLEKVLKNEELKNINVPKYLNTITNKGLKL